MNPETEMDPETELLLTGVLADIARLVFKLPQIEPDSELDTLEATLDNAKQAIAQERRRRQGDPAPG